MNEKDEIDEVDEEEEELEDEEDDEADTQADVSDEGEEDLDDEEDEEDLKAENPGSVSGECHRRPASQAYRRRKRRAHRARLLWPSSWTSRGA